jgi:hypothetical protein
MIEKDEKEKYSDSEDECEGIGDKKAEEKNIKMLSRNRIDFLFLMVWM